MEKSSYTPSSTPRYIFDIPIDGKTYPVYTIENREHAGLNGEPKTWWLYYGQLPANCGSLDPNDENFVPYHKSMERLSWDIRFTQKNVSKIKWDHLSISNTTWCEMHCNGKKIYEFGTHGGEKGMNFAMAKAQYMQTLLLEHPYNFLDPHGEEGRKIYWYGLPATISLLGERTWEIIIRPVYDEWTEEGWWDELWARKYYGIDDDGTREDLDEMKSTGYVVWGDAFSDGNIGWFRK